jgi:hypothetical protein
MPRWIQQGRLVKITRGRYALPVRSRFGTRPSAPESMTAQLNLEGAQQLVSRPHTLASIQAVASPQLRQCWRKSPPAFMMKVAAPTKKQLS